jgi:hypothetical protein
MRRIVVATGAILAAAAAYGGYWLATARTLRSGVERWAAARQAEGRDLHWATIAVDGFPASFRVHVAGIALSGQKPLPFAAENAVLVGEARPWDLRFWRLSAPEGVRLALPTAGETVLAPALDGTLALGRSGGAAMTLSAHDITATGIAAIGLAAGELDLTLPDQPPASHRDTAFAATLRLSGLTLPRAVPALGDRVEALTVSGTVKGAVPRGKLGAALAAWRDDGGTIELDNGSIRWGGLTADASGALALDGALQPIGALTATIEDQDAVIDAAVAQGSLRAGDGNLAKIALGLLARPGPDGKPRLKVPLRLQDDRLYLGPARIATLPPIHWEE